MRNTDLISELLTQESLDEMMMYMVKDNLFQARRIIDENMKSIRYSAELESSNQTQRLKEMMHKELKDMMDELKAKDLTQWKFKLKWAAVGAILPSMLCILQLILR